MMTKADFFAMLARHHPPFRLDINVPSNGWMYQYRAVVRCHGRAHGQISYKTPSGKICGSGLPGTFYLADFLGRSDILSEANRRAYMRAEKALVKYQRWLDEYVAALPAVTP